MKNCRWFFHRFIYAITGLTLSSQVSAASLSYSGRLVNSDGSPVAGPVNLKFEIAYSGSTATIRCTSDVNAVPLTNGVFHAKLEFICPTSTVYEVLSSVPAGEDAVMRVTNETADPDKVYSFQTINAVPVAQMAHQLPKMEATNNQVLTWTGSKWEPKSVTGATGGTVTSVTTGSGLTGGPITTTGTIAIATGGVLDSHLASGIARAKIAGGTPNYVVVNDGSGAFTEVAQLPLAQGGTGANSADLARTNLGLGNAAEASIGYSSGNVMPGDGVPVCLSFQKLQFTGSGPTYWSCVMDNDSADVTKLPLAGGTMSGAINMGNNFITNVPSPSDPGDVVNKQYVDTQISNQWTASAGNLYRISGNIGIGTTSPNVPLAIGGSLFTNTANQIHIVNSGAFSRIAYGEDTNNYGEMVWSDTTDSIAFNTKRAGTTFSNALVIKDDKVGIGTTTPGSALDITKTDPIVRVKNSGGDVGGMFLMNSVNAGWLGLFNPNASTTFGVVPILTSKTYLAWDHSGKIGTVSNSFTTGNPGSPIYRNLLDDGSGKMGIGTTSPTEKLDVSGTATMNASTEGISTYASSGVTYTIADSSLNIRRITLNANATINLPAFTSMWPKVYTLTVFLKQDAVGSRTVNFNGNGGDTVKWDSGSAPSVSLTANKITIVQFTKPSDETVWYGSKVWQED